MFPVQEREVVGLVYRLQFCFSLQEYEMAKAPASAQNRRPNRQESKQTGGQGSTEAGKAEIKGIEGRGRGGGERN